MTAVYSICVSAMTQVLGGVHQERSEESVDFELQNESICFRCFKTSSNILRAKVDSVCLGIIYNNKEDFSYFNF